MPGDTPFYAKNGLVANTGFIANSTQVTLGANITVNTSAMGISGSTANLIINSTALFIGNSTQNVVITSTFTAAVNLNSTYTWTNTHTFNSTVTLNGTVNDGAATFQSQVVTDAATITANCANGRVMTVTLGGNRTFANCTAQTVGTYILHVVQDATGGRTLTWGGMYKWPQGTAPVLSTGANKRDILSFICDGTNMYGSFMPDVR
jgi:hypothetical protein